MNLTSSFLTNQFNFLKVKILLNLIQTYYFWFP